MADNLTTDAARGILDHINGVASYAIVAPIKVALMSANGTKTTAGTEVTGAGYARQSVTISAAASDETATNSSNVLFPNLPNVTVVGWEIYDSSASPKRLWWGPAARNRTVPVGDSYEILAGALDLALH